MQGVVVIVGVQHHGKRAEKLFSRDAVFRFADEQRRFWLPGEPTVSAYRRSARG